MATGPLTQATGPPRFDAGVGIGMLIGDRDYLAKRNETLHSVQVKAHPMDTEIPAEGSAQHITQGWLGDEAHEGSPTSDSSHSEESIVNRSVTVFRLPASLLVRAADKQAGRQRPTLCQKTNQ